MSTCEDDIVESVRRLTESSAFTGWLDTESADSEDLILINNSFVFRDVKTTKADAFLSFRLGDGNSGPEIHVSRGVRFNIDFRRIAAGSRTTSSFDHLVVPSCDHLTPSQQVTGDAKTILTHGATGADQHRLPQRKANGRTCQHR